MIEKLDTISGLNVAQLRENATLSADRIHLDHAGASLLSKATVARMQRHILLEAEVGGYVAQERVMDELEDVYTTLADVLGGQRDDYALTGSAVDSWTKLFYSVSINAGQNIVTAHTEYCANFVAFLHDQKKRGFEIRVANRKENGDVDLDHLESLIDDKTALVAITWVGSSSGQILPAKAVGEITKRKGVPYLLDACQAAGHIPVDFEDVGCDMASGTSRKFLRGPRGVGFLYVTKAMRDKMHPVVMTNQSASWEAGDQIKCREDARLFEAWERSVTNILGFGVALQEYRDLGVKKATGQLRNVSNYLRAKLAAMNTITIGCPEGSEGAIITFNKDGISAAEMKTRLEIKGVAINNASVYHTRLDLEARNIDCMARISPQYLTTQEDCDKFLEILRDI